MYSAITPADQMLKNKFSFGHSSLNFPLKPKMVPFTYPFMPCRGGHLAGLTSKSKVVKLSLRHFKNKKGCLKDPTFSRASISSSASGFCTEIAFPPIKAPLCFHLFLGGSGQKSNAVFDGQTRPDFYTLLIRDTEFC